MITLNDYTTRNAERLSSEADAELTDAELAAIARIEYEEAQDRCAVVVDAWRYRVSNQRLDKTQAAEVVERWLGTNGAKAQAQAESLEIDIVEQVTAR